MNRRSGTRCGLGSNRTMTGSCSLHPCGDYPTRPRSGRWMTTMACGLGSRIPTRLPIWLAQLGRASMRRIPTFLPVLIYTKSCNQCSRLSAWRMTWETRHSAIKAKRRSGVGSSKGNGYSQTIAIKVRDCRLLSQKTCTKNFWISTVIPRRYAWSQSYRLALPTLALT